MLITHNFGLVAEIADKIAIMYAGEIVEWGNVYEIFRNPMHPYSALLMDALPRKRKTEGRLQTIEGSVPRILEDVPGCRFANRCPFAMNECFITTPDTVELNENHLCKCHKISKEISNEQQHY